LLRDKSLLLLGVSEVLVDGVHLEGHGVEPDVEVADRLPFAEGKEPQFEKAWGLASS
jgi:C-terminal processing protease CtpA/Prc